MNFSELEQELKVLEINFNESFTCVMWALLLTDWSNEALKIDLELI